MVLNRERSYFFDSCSHNLYSFENVRKAHQWDILSPSVGTVCWALGMETQIDLTIVQPWTFLGHSSGQQEHWSVTFRLGIVLTPGFFTCEWTEGRGRIQSHLMSWKRGAKSWRFPIPARLLCPWAAPQGVPAGGIIPLPARGWLSLGPTLSRHLRVSPSAPIPLCRRLSPPRRIQLWLTQGQQWLHSDHVHVFTTQFIYQAQREIVLKDPAGPNSSLGVLQCWKSNVSN